MKSLVESKDIALDDQLYDDVLVDVKPLYVSGAYSPKATRNLLVEADLNASDITARYRLPNAVIELRPIDQADSWHGKKGIHNFDKHKIIEAFVEKGIYMTGLTDEEKKYLEAVTGYNLSNHYNPYTEHSFYGKMLGRVKLENRTILLQLTDPLSYIKYKLILNHPLVANSLADYENGLNPQASHYIVDNEEEEIMEIKKASTFKEADKLWADLTLGIKRAVLTVIMQSDVSLLAPDTVEARLLNIKNTTVDKFISVARQPKDIIANKALIISCVARLVILHKDGFYSYNETTLGGDLDSAALYLSNPNNQELKLRILTHFKSKVA